jgi:protein-disulfide isomerase
MLRIAVLLSLAAGAGALGDSPSSGKSAGVATAPVMIEVFSDFQCPGCKGFHEQTLRALLSDYVAKGKVYLIHREFPLPIHAYAKEAALWADAAARVGKYAAVCDALFASQGAWSANGKVEDAACAALTAAEAKKVRALVKDPAIAGEVQRELDLGRAAGVTGTPTLVITHQMRRYPVSGTLNYNLIRRLLDDLLAR